MKLIGVCLLAFTVAQASILSSSSVECGKTYLYEYKAYTVSGVPLVSNERSGLAIWSQVSVFFQTEDKIVIQLNKPVMRQINLEPETTLSVDSVPHLDEVSKRENEFIPLPQYVQETLTKFIEKPVEINLNKDGQISKVLAHKDEPEWILALKSGIYSQLTLPKMTGTVLKTTEDTLMGRECIVDYDVMTPEVNTNNKWVEDNQILTKKFSLNSCKHPIVHDDLIKFANEPRKDSRDGKLQSSFITKFNVSGIETSRPVINQCITEGRFTMSIFKPNTGEATTYTRQEMELIKVEDKKLSTRGHNLIQRRQSVASTLSIHEQLHKHSDKPEPTKLTLIKNLFNDIVQTIESESKPTFEILMAEKYTLAVELMNSLEETSSFKSIVDMAIKRENKIMRQMIVQALSNCRSPALIKSLKTIEPKLRPSEMSIIITTLGVNGDSTYDLIHTLKTLYVQVKEESLKEQTLLTIGTQVHQLCRPYRIHGTEIIKKNEECTEGFQAEFMNFFRQEYAHSTEEHRRMIILKAIGNSGLEMSHTLEQLINSEETPMELRVHAIYAMRRNRDIESVLNILMPVYRRHSTPVELRIAAFNTLIDIEPTSRMLVSLVSHLNEEPIMQLGNYVYSYLDTMVKLPTFYTPTQNLTLTAQSLLPTVQRFEGGLWYSQNRQFMFRSIGLKFFEHLETSFISTPEQAIPRAGLLKFSREYCGYFLKAMEMGFRLEGADTFVQELFTKYFAPEVMQSYSLFTQNFVRDLKRIHTILREDDILSRNIEKPEGHIFFKVLGNEVGVWRLETNTFTELGNTIFEELMTLGKNRIFDVQSLCPIQLKAQTPMGVMMFTDVTMLSMTSLHTDNAEITNKNAIWAKHVTLRNMLKNRVMFGVHMGPMEVAIGHCKHIRTVLPHTWEVIFDTRTGKSGVEVFWNVEDPMFKTSNENNFKLVELDQIPIRYFLAIDSDKKTIDITLEPMVLHPLLRVTEQRYDFDFVGHKFTSIQHMRDLTLREPVYPYDGRHIITLSFYNKQVKPFGIKLDFETMESKKDNKVGGMMTVSLNPRVPEHMKTIDLAVFVPIVKSETVKTPELVLEVTPKWMKQGTYRLFFSHHQLKGRDNQVFRWLEAGEDFDIEKLFGMQYGWNEEFTVSRQDFLMKYTTSKSELQKFFEREDKVLEGSECERCEKVKSETGVWTNIHCERCLLKRQTRTEKVFTIFLNEEKMRASKWVKSLLEFMDESNMEFYNIFESKQLKEPVTPLLVREESEILSRFMSQISQNKIEAFKRIETVQPYWTECNVTSFRGNSILRFTNVPMYPAGRRLDNLHIDRLTDVLLQREGVQNRGVCHIDSRNVVKTMDDVVYRIPESTDCERILARDCTEKDTFQIDVANTKESTRVVNIKMGSRNIKVVPTKDSFTVMVDSTKVPMETVTIGEYKYQVFGSESLSVSGSITEIDAPKNKKVNELRLDIPELYTTIYMVEDYVKLEVPFWYKNKMCGLCGDFNTEKVIEFKLPNRSEAKDLKSFLEAYSSDKCRNL